MLEVLEAHRSGRLAQVGRAALMRAMVDSEVRLGMPDCRRLAGPQVRAPLETR